MNNFNFTSNIILVLAFFTPLTALAQCDCGSADPNNPCMGNSAEYSRSGGSFSNQFNSFSIKDTTVRFEFSCEGGACACGQFANGRDYWVAPASAGGSVQVTRMTPDPTGSGGSYRNGAMYGPTDRSGNQGYDGRNAGGKFGGYRSDLSLSVPFNVNPADEGRPITILKGVSTRQADNCTKEVRICLDQVETLTVVDTPPGNVFRPAYYGHDKTMYPATLFNDAFLSNVAPVSGTTSWDKALETMMGVRPGLHSDNQNTRQGYSAVLNFFPPGSKVDGYAGYVGVKVQQAILKLTEEATGADTVKKRQLAKYFAQYGIDLWAVFSAPDPGDPCGHWEANGGFNNNFFAPILFADKLLGQDWANTINSVMSTLNGKNCFAETGFIQPKSVTSKGKGVPLFGNIEGNLGIENYTCSGNANNVNNNFLTDGLGRGKDDNKICQSTGSGCPTPYMSCCTHGHWLASAMAIWLTPEIRNSFPSNAEHWLTYVDRARSAGAQVGKEFGAYCNSSNFSITGFNTGYDTAVSYNMWNQYRECSKTQDCPGITVEGTFLVPPFNLMVQ